MFARRSLSTTGFSLLFSAAATFSAVVVSAQDVTTERPPLLCANPDWHSGRCKVGTVQKRDGLYAIYADYKLDDAIVDKDVYLTFTISSSNSQAHTLRITGFNPIESQTQQIQIVPLGDCDTSLDASTGWLKKVCPYKIEIRREAAPKTYEIPLKLESESKASGEASEKTTLIFPLHVGVAQDGPLRVKEVSDCCVLGIRSAERNLDLTLFNGFQDYDLKLREVTIKSTPVGLLGKWQKKEIAQAITCRHDASVSLQLTTPSVFGLLLDGFTKDKGLKLDFSYNDAYGRQITGSQYIFPSDKVRFRLSQPAWFLFMLFGVIVGTLIKYFNQRSQVSRTEQLIWVLGTAAVGILVSVLSLALKIGIDLSSMNISNEHPIGVLFIGLVSALGGIALIERLLPFLGKKREMAKYSGEVKQ